ncbi:MAG: hypothetical protein ACOY5W_17160 [Pseudomonadota bacterium]
MDQIYVGLIKTTGASGILAVGSTAVIGQHVHKKRSVGGSTVTGDYAFAPLGLGLLNDQDLIDHPAWIGIR